MLSHLSERGQELTFSLALLLSVGIGFVAVEKASQVYVAKLADADVDWNTMVDNVGFISSGESVPRFHPNTTFNHLSFNEFGFRGPKLANPKPDNVVRVAYLGNSVMFSGEMLEEQTVPSRTTALLKQKLPQCSFEYVNVAGPSYTMEFLAKLWKEGAAKIKADLAVIYAGTVEELIHKEEEELVTAGIAPPKPVEVNEGLFAESAFIGLVKKQLVLTSPLSTEVETKKFSTKYLSPYFDDLSDELVDALKGTPVLAVGYREALRGDQPARKQLWASRHMRSYIPGLSVNKAIELSEFVVSELERVSQRAGWHFADLVRDIPGDKEHFRDFVHFSDKGALMMSERLANSIATRVSADCAILDK
jgi:hypothetical protein